MNIETYVADVIEGKRGSPLIRGIFYAASHLFEAGVLLRNFAFDKHFLKEKKAHLPVISIGNIVAGGAGKTPFIQRIVKDLPLEIKVAVLSRGYRSEIEKSGGSLHLIDKGNITPTMCGDEPYLLFKSLPHALFFVGKDRISNANQALYHGANLILLDDGMQYRTLHRDLEIVMLDSRFLYRKDYFLPFGYLRDSPKRLQKADAIIVNSISNFEYFTKVQEKVRQISNAPLIGTRMVPVEIETICGERLQDLKGQKIGLFCGLGNPHSFCSTALEMGGEILEKWSLPDHGAIKISKLKQFAHRCIEHGCDLILCSEKDWVKLPTDLDLPLPLGFLKAELQVIAGKELYKGLISRIEKLSMGRQNRETVD